MSRSGGPVGGTSLLRVGPELKRRAAQRRKRLERNRVYQVAHLSPRGAAIAGGSHFLRAGRRAAAHNAASWRVSSSTQSSKNQQHSSFLRGRRQAAGPLSALLARKFGSASQPASPARAILLRARFVSRPPTPALREVTWVSAAAHAHLSRRPSPPPTLRSAHDAADTCGASSRQVCAALLS